MSGLPKLTAVLASHNRKARTLACLESLFACDRAIELRAILFDDASSDGTAQAVRECFPSVSILTGDGEAFWAGGMRAAFAAALAAGTDYVLWLNDDVRLEVQALSRLLATHGEEAAAGYPLSIVGGAVADPSSGHTTYAGIRRVSAWRPLRFRRQAPHPVRAVVCDTLVGNVVLIPRATADEIGGIDSAYRHTLADLDYGLRVSQAGGRCVLTPGHVGWCEANTRGSRWFNTELSLRARWRLLGHPLGFPLRPWLHFARRHGGPAWLVFALLPFWRLVVPVGLTRLIDRRRQQPASVGLRHA